MQRSGHTSSVVRNCEKPSDAKLQENSKVLQPPAPQIKSCREMSNNKPESNLKYRCLDWRAKRTRIKTSIF